MRYEWLFSLQVEVSFSAFVDYYIVNSSRGCLDTMVTRVE